MWCTECLRWASRVSYSRDGIHVAPCGHHAGVVFERPVRWKARAA